MESDYYANQRKLRDIENDLNDANVSLLNKEWKKKISSRLPEPDLEYFRIIKCQGFLSQRQRD